MERAVVADLKEESSCSCGNAVTTHRIVFEIDIAGELQHKSLCLILVLKSLLDCV